MGKKNIYLYIHTHIYISLHSNTAEYTFFSGAHRTFSRIDHMLGHKTSLSNFKKTEIKSSIFSDHNGVTLEINYRKNKRKFRYVEAKQYAIKQPMGH